MAVLLRVLSRIGFFIGLPVIGYILTYALIPLKEVLSIEDAVQFFLSAIVFVSFWGTTTKLFTEKDGINPPNLFSLTVSGWTLSFMLAVIWSVTWRATGHSNIYGETYLRLAFRYVATCSSAYAIVSQGSAPVEETISPQRWVRIIAIIIAAALTATLVLYSDDVKRNFHDWSSPPDAPAPSDMIQ